MGVALPHEVRDELVGQVTVGEPGTPATQVQLVDAHGLLVSGGTFSPGNPLRVVPGVVTGGDDGGIARSLLAESGHGVDLLVPVAPLVLDAELVEGSLTNSLDEGAPDPRSGDELHGVTGPPVEVCDDLHGLGIGCPHGESGAGDLTTLVVIDGDDVGTQTFPALGVPT